jgi:hypothetical protein
MAVKGSNALLIPEMLASAGRSGHFLHEVLT